MKRIRDFIPNARPYYFVTTCGKIVNPNLINYFMKPNLSNGYERIEINFDYESENSGLKCTFKKKFFVHRLVGMAYLGLSAEACENTIAGETIDRINSVKTDNYIGNLQIMSREDNYKKHMEEVGYVEKPIKSDVKNYVRRIEISQHKEIVDRFLNGERAVPLGKEYGVTNVTILNIVKKYVKNK
ncbi:MAG: hypothetical protein ACRC6B_11385 [Fusobacteriaceae bacterium]